MYEQFHTVFHFKILIINKDNEQLCFDARNDENPKPFFFFRKHVLNDQVTIKLN